MRYFSLCAMAKNENRYIAEWVDYHLAVGVEHIYLYDDGSDVPLAKELQSYIERGHISIHRPRKPHGQLRAYNDCIVEQRDSSVWIGFIDVDEYLVPNASNDLREILLKNQDNAGLAVSQILFGSSGHISRPKGLQIEEYLESYPASAPVNRHIKSLVQPKYVKSACSAHHFNYLPGHRCVNEEGFPVSSPFSYHTVNDIQLNHYYYRSQQDFEMKMQRGIALAREKKKGSTYDINIFYNHTSDTLVRDESILRFAPLLKAKDPFIRTLRYPAQSQSIECIRHISQAIQQGRIEDAKNAALSALYTFKDDMPLLVLLSQCYLLLGDISLAEKMLTRSIVQSASPLAYFLLMKIHMQRGEIQKACSLAHFLDNQMQRDWKRFSPPDNSIAMVLTSQ